MKQFTLLLTTVLLALTTMAQTPQAISYQAVARNPEGNPMINQEITVKVSIIEGEVQGSVVYSEIHDLSTNSIGMFSIQIGNPDIILTGNLSEINWGSNLHFLKLEIDDNGGLNFIEMGTTQLISVPYALFAENTANPEDADSDPINELQTISKEGSIISLSNGGGTIIDNVADADSIPTNELQELFRNGDTITLSLGGGYFVDETLDADADPANELQTLIVDGYEVTLTQEGGSFLSGLKSYTQEEIDTMVVYNGLTIHNASTNGLNYYFDGNWYSIYADCEPQPTQSDAGPDQIDINDTVVVLDANTPIFGEGEWIIISGTGGDALESNNPSSLFSGEPGILYELEWRITNTCGNSSDRIFVSFAIPWQCGMPFEDYRDGKMYKSVLIGEQCWMAENLAYLPEVSPSSELSDTDPHYYVYGYEGTDVNTAKSRTRFHQFGALYNWPASISACPEGWKLPDYSGDFGDLFSYVNSQPDNYCSYNGDAYYGNSLCASVMLI